MLRHTKQIVALALPSIFSFATITASGTINLILVGQMGALVIAIVGVCNILMYCVWALFSGMGYTVNYLVAQNYGAKRMDRGVRITQVALTIAVCIAFISVVIGIFSSRAILTWMGGTPDFVDTGTAYLQLRFAAIAFSIPIFVFHGFMRGIGDAKTPMVLTLINNTFMVVLTYGLAFGNFGLPNLGLAGAGLGMMIGEMVGCLGCLYVYFVRLSHRFHTRTFHRLNWSEYRFVGKESGKLGMQEFAMSLSMLVFTRFVMELGTVAVAANEVALNVMSFGYMPAFAFGATATILVGQQLGRGDSRLAKRLGTETAILGSLFLLVLGIVEFVLAEPIARLYSDDPAVYLLTADLIKVAAFLQLFDGFYNFYGGGLRGIGDTTFLLKASLALNWLLFVPAAFLFVFVLDLGSVGAWSSFYLFLTVSGITLMVRYYRTDWEQVRLKEPAGQEV